MNRKFLSIAPGTPTIVNLMFSKGLHGPVTCKAHCIVQYVLTHLFTKMCEHGLPSTTFSFTVLYHLHIIIKTEISTKHMIALIKGNALAV